MDTVPSLTLGSTLTILVGITELPARRPIETLVKTQKDQSTALTPRQATDDRGAGDAVVPGPDLEAVTGVPDVMVETIVEDVARKNENLCYGLPRP